jgi:hypothetical protein
LKKLAGSVRFWFYKPKTEKRTEPNRTQTKKKPEPKPSQTEPKRFELIFVLKNQTETGRFEPVSVFFKKKILV